MTSDLSSRVILTFASSNHITTVVINIAIIVYCMLPIAYCSLPTAKSRIEKRHEWLPSQFREQQLRFAGSCKTKSGSAVQRETAPSQNLESSRDTTVELACHTSHPAVSNCKEPNTDQADIAPARKKDQQGSDIKKLP